MVFIFLFWISLGFLVYVFFGFVAVLCVLSQFKRSPTQKRDITPSVSIVVCAFNEEKHIRQKIDNCLSLEYPPDRLEILIISDGSTDDTNRLLKEHNFPLLKTYCTSRQQGKTACQNIAAEMATHDVLFFTDATVMHPPEALKILVRSLHDPSVGCVTGKPIFNCDTGAASLGLSKREKYEFYLRQKLGSVTTLFGAQDCMYVIPRALYVPVRADLDSGFVGPLQLLERGYRTVYEPEALALVNRSAPNIKDEYIRRSRIALRGMRGLLHMRHLMNPFRYGFTAVSLVSTRLLRWLTPVFLLGGFISNLFLLASPFYQFTLIVQVAFYTTAVVAFVVAERGYRLISVFYIPLYFCVLALSAMSGLRRLLSGESGQVWPTRR
jgi:glycosyltransferase involved in cell wall biosynthesis